MNESKQPAVKPFLVWENKQQGNRGHEATVREVHTGDEGSVNMPIIRVVSSGFGSKTTTAKGAVESTKALRCAA